MSLDVSSYEHAYDFSDFEKIRRDMLNKDSGSSEPIVAWVPLQGTQKFRLMNVIYFYASVTGTPFRCS